MQAIERRILGGMKGVLTFSRLRRGVWPGGVAAVVFSAVAGIGGAVEPARQSQIWVERGVAFLPGERKELLDVYHPIGRRSGGGAGERVPAVVVIHGGGFYGGSRAGEREEELCRFLSGAGYLVVSLDYRLSDRGQAVWPENLHDCKRGVAWLRRNSDRLGLDAGRIAVLGASAGGHLAAMVALTGPGDGLEPPELAGADCRVQACVDLYGPTDLTVLNRLSMLGPPRAEAPELYRQASPPFFADAEDPPVLILHGRADDNVDMEHSRGLEAALKHAGAACQLELLEGLGHGFGLSPGGIVAGKVLGFLDGVLRPESRGALPGGGAPP